MSNFVDGHNANVTTLQNALHHKESSALLIDGVVGFSISIVEKSGYLNYLVPRDVVLADREFDVADWLALFGATLDIPAFTRCCNQLSPTDVEATTRLSKC